MKKSINPDIWVTIDKIKHTLGWNDAELLDRLQLTKKQLVSEKQLNLSPRLDVITNLTESLGISIESLITGKIDFQTLKAHSVGKFEELPERYSVATFSKKKTTIHLLDFIEEKFGWQTKKNVLTHFQIKEIFCKDPDGAVNFLLPSDICEFVSLKYKMPLAVIRKMGAHSTQTNQNTPAGKTLASLGSPKSLLENFFGYLVNRHFEKNQNYKILKLTDQFCIVETHFRQELKDALKNNQIGNIFACHSIAGTMSSLTSYLGLPSSQVTKIDCIHQGGFSCKYLIDFELPQQLHLFDHPKETRKAPSVDLH